MCLKRWEVGREYVALEKEHGGRSRLLKGSWEAVTRPLGHCELGKENVIVTKRRRFF